MRLSKNEYNFFSILDPQFLMFYDGRVWNVFILIFFTKKEEERYIDATRCKARNKNITLFTVRQKI